VTRDRQRFERELHRLRGFHFKRLLVIGTEQEIRAGQYQSNVYAFEARYDVPVIFSPTPEQAALLVERWAYWYAREVQKNATACQCRVRFRSKLCQLLDKVGTNSLHHSFFQFRVYCLIS
jgi:hypothetical protein